MKSLVIRLFPLFLLFSCAQEQQPSLKALLLDLKASSYVNKKQTDKALNSYYQILETDSELPSVHSNIGIIFIEDKKIDEALKSLQHALKLAELQKDLKLQFAIHYNMGVYFGLQKKIPEALENYQAALEIKPDSKETKHNIELLIQNGSGKSSEGEDKKDKSDPGEDQDKKDQKDKDGKDKDDKNKDDKESEKDKKNKDYKQNAKYKPKPFKSGELSEGDVKKILGELKNQEQKIRANFEKKERKENKNEKDW